MQNDEEVNEIINKLLATDKEKLDKIIYKLLLEIRLKGKKGAYRVRILLKDKACYYCKKYGDCYILNEFLTGYCKKCEHYNNMLEYGCKYFEFNDEIDIDCSFICDKGGNVESCLYYVLGLCD